MKNNFQVPLILPDLRAQETIGQIIGSLNQLTKVSDNIFDKIDQKCEEFQSTLEALSKVRVQTYYDSSQRFYLQKIRCYNCNSRLNGGKPIFQESLKHRIDTDLMKVNAFW